MSLAWIITAALTPAIPTSLHPAVALPLPETFSPQQPEWRNHKIALIMPSRPPSPTTLQCLPVPYRQGQSFVRVATSEGWTIWPSSVLLAPPHGLWPSALCRPRVPPPLVPTLGLSSAVALLRGALLAPWPAHVPKLWVCAIP